LRRALIACVAVFVTSTIGCFGLWWRLSSGPVSLDLVTPWLTSAVEVRLGGQHRVEVGGTQLERDEDGRAAIRIRDIVVRDPDGAVVASAPKAEVGLSGLALLTGRLQAERLSLIGAEMAVRIESDGQLTIFAGADKRPIATTPAIVSGRPGTSWQSGNALPSETVPNPISAFMNWLDRLDALGFDGGNLNEFGLKSGSLAVDDRRNGKRWNFGNINLSLTRPKEGGLAIALTSTGADGPWSLTATVGPRGEGHRAIETVLRDVSPKDILLALRLGDGRFAADMPLSAIMRAEIATDGTTHSLEGRVVAGAGFVGEMDDPSDRILIDEGQLSFRWDPANRQVVVPIELLSGSNRITLLSQIMVPRDPSEPWNVQIGRGVIALAAADRKRETALVLDRIAVRARIEPALHRIELEQGEISGVAAGVVVSGMLDYSGIEPRLAIGLAGTRMTASALKRLWPVFAATKVRNWVLDHVMNGAVERLVIATNAPLPTLRANGPPVPSDGLSIELVGSNATLRPVDALPAIRDADVTVSVNGRYAVVRVGRGTVDLPSGRKLTVSNGVFEVPDTHPKPPPARVRFRVEGAADAAAELTGMELLRDNSGISLDPATSRGAVVAQVTLALPIAANLQKDAVDYTIEADLSNFSADRLVRSHKVEANALRVTATPGGVQVKGDVRIAGVPASVDYRRPAGTADAEIRIQGTFDDGARNRLGFNPGGTISGPIPIKLNGHIGATSDRDSRYAVDADLTQAKISDILPGWIKPAGKHSRLTFTYVERAQSARIEDVVLDGPGASVKGNVELDGDGEIQSVSFPVYGLSDGDKASLRADRGGDGTMRATLRGEVYDARGIIKTSMTGAPADANSKPPRDIDLDVKLGAVAGFHGEALRGFELRMARRAGQIRSFAMSAKLGRDAQLIGDLRVRNGGRQAIYVETNDAGAMFRFTDLYPRLNGGRMWISMDPPSGDRAPIEGFLNMRDFVIRGEPVLERVATGGGPPGEQGARAFAPTGSGVTFSRMRVEFTKSPGRFAIRDGVVEGPTVGATIEGHIDFNRDEVRMRGTFVPAYALNNIFGRVPVLGFFLGGGQNEGLLGVTYEVVGPPNAPTLRVNPMSAVAPGIFRKLFEFSRTDDRNATPFQQER
jgi:hypothetical protein